MSQRSVEIIIGRLMTDEDFRRSFGRDRAATLDALVASGTELTRFEIASLLAIDPVCCARFAGDLPDRLQKASLAGSPDLDADPERSAS
jgi:hypothetical protein